MRILGTPLALLLLTASLSSAQQSAPPGGGSPPPAAPAAPLDPASNRLDAVLIQWEKTMTPVQSLVAQVVRTTTDHAFKDKSVFVGTARYMRPNLAMLEMQKKDRPEIYEKFISTGSYLYEYVASQKQIRFRPIPQPQPGQVAEDNVLTFIFGIKAATAKNRYGLTLTKEDQYYLYIDIQPRQPEDQADFSKARLVLLKQTFLPRQLWFVQPNGNEVLWDIPRIDRDVALNRNDFVKPNLPDGWKMVEMPRIDNVPPRVVRPNR